MIKTKDALKTNCLLIKVSLGFGWLKAALEVYLYQACLVKLTRVPGRRKTIHDISKLSKRDS